MSRKNNQEIADYYNQSAWLYKMFIYSHSTLGMHFGFWDKETRNYEEAILNQFRFVVNKSAVNSAMKVLDAGCGVGGGAIYVAKNIGSQVVGITITPSQVLAAKDNAHREGVEDLVDFMEMDFHKMDFADDAFDLVFAIESVCHAYPKDVFLKEAHRVLKPGGKLIISDGYMLRMPKNAKEKGIIAKLCSVWRLRELIQIKEMSRLIKEVGFDLLEVESQSASVRPTFKRMHLLIILGSPFVWISKYLKLSFLKIIKDNSDSMKYYILGDSLGLTGHYTHVAIKPKQ